MGDHFAQGREAEEAGDDARAEPLFRAAAEEGDAHAALHLAFLLERRGAPDEAEEWHRRAADAGESQSAWRLGVLAQRRGDDA